MRILTAGVLLTVLCLASIAPAAPVRKVLREVDTLGREIEAKVVNRANTSIRVAATGCSLCIEYNPQRVAFDLPLQGAAVAESEQEDGLVITQRSMMRRLQDRPAEPFERLSLRFGKHDLGAVRSLFEEAIRACSK